ncbi:MAG: SUMF1/EgtB/PvdO family nonheme iron enzyme, partial [Pigmentiphaga sp.]
MPPAQRLSLALLVAACLAPLGVSAQLSPQAQRDLLEVRLLDRIKAEDHGNYLTLLSEYRQVGGLPGLEMRYYEAVALFNTKQAIPAHHVLSTFINAAGSSHPLYVEALSLFTKVETAANQARQKQADIEQFLTQAPKQCAESAAQAKLALQARGAGAAFRECPFAPEMVIIPGGTFRMAQDGNSIATLVPPTPFPVTVRGFAMGKHEVTHEEWEACIAG